MLARPTKVENARIHAREWRDKNRVHSAAYGRDRHLRKKYGITAAEWEALFASQEYACASCGSPTPQGPYWHTDHAGLLPCTRDKVRGIVCLSCNHAAGKGGIADVLRLRDLTQYLEARL